MLMCQLEAAACHADQRKAAEVMDQWENTDMTNAELVKSLISIAGFGKCSSCPECSIIMLDSLGYGIPDTHSKTCIECTGWETWRI